MAIDYAAWRFWLDIAYLLGLGGVGVYSYLVNRTKANRDAIQVVDGRISALGERMTTLENDVRHLPDHEDLGAIHEKVNTIASSMGKIEGELTALNRNFALLFEDRLNQGSRR